MPSLVRVFIPTDQHLAEVRGLVVNPLRGQAIIDGNGDPLTNKVALNYQQFVCRGTGFIEELYGQANFSLHLSMRIDQGKSWQLGVFLVHALQHAGRLASEKDEADTIVWATGEMNRLNYDQIIQVAKVQEKLDLSIDRLGKERARGRRVIVAWPRANDGDIRSDAKEKLQKLGIEILGPATAAGASSGDGQSETGIEYLRELLTKVDLRAPAWPATAASKKLVRPFRGLNVFEEADGEAFLGRGRARAEALEQMRDAADLGCAFLLVHGASGVGKSSFGRAGLINGIADRDAAWRTSIMVPGRGGVPPVSALCEALAQSGLGGNDLEKEIPSGPAAVASRIIAALAGATATSGSKLILLVDQLEELLGWRQRGDADGAISSRERGAFAEILERLACSGKVWVIATIRAEYLQSLLKDISPFKRLASASRLYLLQTPTKAELREIITGTGVTFEGEDETGRPFKEVLIDAATAAPESLPLLQVALEELYNSEGKSGTIRYAAYKEQKGGIEGAIGSWAQRRVEARVEDANSERSLDGRALDDVILELGQYDRISDTVVPRELIVGEKSFDPAHQKVLKVLEEARLVVVDVMLGRTTARVAHAAVLSHWDRAAQLFEAHQTEIKQRERLQTEAEDWRTRGEAGELLIPDGARLREAQDLLAGRHIQVSELIEKYIEASNERADRQRDAERRKQAEVIAAKNEKISWIIKLSGAMALVLVGGIFLIGRYNLENGGSIFSSGPGRDWQNAYDEEKKTNDLYLSSMLNLMIAAQKTGSSISVADIKKILPLPAAKKDIILSLLMDGRDVSAAEMERLLGLSPAGLEDEAHLSRSASEMGRHLKGLVVEPGQRVAPSPASDAPPPKLPLIPANIENRDFSEAARIQKGLLMQQPREPASHDPCVGVLGRSPVPCGPSGNKPIQLPPPNSPDPAQSSSAPDVSSPK